MRETLTLRFGQALDDAVRQRASWFVECRVKRVQPKGQHATRRIIAHADHSDVDPGFQPTGAQRAIRAGRGRSPISSSADGGDGSSWAAALTHCRPFGSWDTVPIAMFKRTAGAPRTSTGSPSRPCPTVDPSDAYRRLYATTGVELRSRYGVAGRHRARTSAMPTGSPAGVADRRVSRSFRWAPIDRRPPSRRR